jgi:hypothetical protein
MQQKEKNAPKVHKILPKIKEEYSLFKLPQLCIQMNELASFNMMIRDLQTRLQSEKLNVFERDAFKNLLIWHSLQQTDMISRAMETFNELFPNFLSFSPSPILLNVQANHQEEEKKELPTASRKSPVPKGKERVETPAFQRRNIAKSIIKLICQFHKKMSLNLALMNNNPLNSPTRISQTEASDTDQTQLNNVTQSFNEQQQEEPDDLEDSFISDVSPFSQAYGPLYHNLMKEIPDIPSQIVREGIDIFKTLEQSNMKSDFKNRLDNLLKESETNLYVLDVSLTALERQLKLMQLGIFQKKIADKNRHHYRNVFTQYRDDFLKRRNLYHQKSRNCK